MAEPGRTLAQPTRAAAFAADGQPAYDLRHLLAYGVLGLPLAFAALPIYVHVPRLYAEGVGLSLSVIGSAWLALIRDRLVRMGFWFGLQRPCC